MSGDQAGKDVKSPTAETVEQTITPVGTLKNFKKPSNIITTANGLKIHSNLNPYALEFYPSSLKSTPETQANEEIKKLIFKEAKDNENCEQIGQTGIENLSENIHKNHEEQQQNCIQMKELKSTLVDDKTVIPNLITIHETKERQQNAEERKVLNIVLANEPKAIPNEVSILKPEYEQTQELKPILVEETKFIPNQVSTQKPETKQKIPPAQTANRAAKEIKGFEKVVAVRSRLNALPKGKASTSLMNSSKITESSKTTIPRANTHTANKPCSSSVIKSAVKPISKVETAKNKDSLSQKSSSSTEKSTSCINSRSSAKCSSRKVEQVTLKNHEKDSKLKKPIPKTPRSTIASNLRKMETQNVS